MLIAIQYDRIGKGKNGNSLEMMRQHLTHLKENFPILLPGDSLPKNKIAVCLTFDGAFFDFYHYVYPLLKELDIRALLGIPVMYILDSTDVDPKERLSVPSSLAMQDGFYEYKAPFCTWSELKEMTCSGHVEAASFSYMHCNLTFNFVDLGREVVKSKEILETKLGQGISSFIYPFGKSTPAIEEFVRKHHPYTFHNLDAANSDWREIRGPICRINGNNMAGPTSLVSLPKLSRYFLKSWLH